MLSLCHMCYLCMYNIQVSSGLIAIHNISQNQSVLAQGPVDIKVNYPREPSKHSIHSLQIAYGCTEFDQVMRPPSIVNFFGGRALVCSLILQTEASPYLWLFTLPFYTSFSALYSYPEDTDLHSVVKGMAWQRHDSSNIHSYQLVLDQKYHNNIKKCLTSNCFFWRARSTFRPHYHLQNA